MAQRIVIDPISRISGFLELRAEAEQDIITNAEAEGLLYRGFETMLVGRQPLDAVYFTERICGICSAAHSTASALALEDALKISPAQNDIYIRDIIHGFEFIQNHLRHFYLLMLPDYVKITSLPFVSNQQYNDFRIPENINHLMEEHYTESFEFASLAHEGQAVLGGKAPHNHGIFAGGVTCTVDPYKLEKVKAIIRRISDFVNTAMREDADNLALFYPDYFEMGMAYPNFMTYGVFTHEEEDIHYVNPGIMVNGIRSPFQPEKITEQIKYSWYESSAPDNTVNLAKPDGYTFIKAPRYDGLPMEVGPLARMLISGEYTRGYSCMDRNIARMLETAKILSIIEKLADRVELLPNSQREYLMPDSAQGAGLIDTTRGALGHWINIKNKVISNYNIITPSVWNLSPRDNNGILGVIEKSLVGTKLRDTGNPIEIGRIARSFDPCVSCATHLVRIDGKETVIELPV